LVGSPGCGRTTLLRILATLVRSTSGRVEIDGIDIASDTFRARPLVAYAGHERIDGNGLRVDEYLRFVAFARKRSVSSIEPVTALVGLEARMPIDALSPDVQPRLALAAALIAAPAVLLLDEPFRLLDTNAHAGVAQWIRAARDAGTTIIISGRATDDVSEVCQRVARLEAGRVVELAASRRSAAVPVELVGA
jgi:ABC-2 type transport system ATP-binding protein